MKVSRITLWSVDLTSHDTYYMADGKTCDTVKSHVLCLETDTAVSYTHLTLPTILLV